MLSDLILTQKQKQELFWAFGNIFTTEHKIDKFIVM